MLNNPVSIAIDSDCASKIEELKKEANELNIKLIWLHINPPEERIISNLKNNTPYGVHRNAEEAIEAYHRRRKMHQETKYSPFTYIFDTSRNNLDEQMEEAAKIIGKETRGT